LQVRFFLLDLDLDLPFLKRTWTRTWTCPFKVDLDLDLRLGDLDLDLAVAELVTRLRETFSKLELNRGRKKGAFNGNWPYLGNGEKQGQDYYRKWHTAFQMR